MQLLQVRDGRSGQDARVTFSPPELESKTALQKNPLPLETLAWAAWIIAKLGGWYGYPKSKPPGPINFRHGLQYCSVPAFDGLEHL